MHLQTTDTDTVCVSWWCCLSLSISLFFPLCVWIWSTQVWKEATTQLHVQWSNPEHTKKRFFFFFEKISTTTKFEFESVKLFPKRPQSPELISSYMVYREVVPPCPRPDIIANVHFIISSPGPMMSHCAMSPFPFSGLECLCLKAVSFVLPHLDHADVALQLNSSIIPYHINFLKPPGSLSYPCYRTLSHSMSFSSVHIIPSSTLRSPVM